MRNLTHEKKILENIEELSFCTSCLDDYLALALIPSETAWEYLCCKCHTAKREQSKQAAQTVFLRRGKLDAQ